MLDAATEASCPQSTKKKTEGTRTETAHTCCAAISTMSPPPPPLPPASRHAGLVILIGGVAPERGVGQRRYALRLWGGVYQVCTLAPSSTPACLPAPSRICKPGESRLRRATCYNSPYIFIARMSLSSTSSSFSSSFALRCTLACVQCYNLPALVDGTRHRRGVTDENEP